MLASLPSFVPTNISFILLCSCMQSRQPQTFQENGKTDNIRASVLCYVYPHSASMWYGWHVVRCIPDIFKLWKYLRPFVVAVCPVERLGVCLAQKRSPSTGYMYTVFHWKRGTQSRPQLQGKKRNREKRYL